ncbi:hypothetical protein LC087_07445 [Bacillus carboniphilus]|uniref:Lipoprotein n=1 Tax=Bacillus carboniphilus TaxID=86663 RepID=A0ABY9JZR9_9BACI|nr:hypothetical protein [Bacillus carboniphilus]WLR43935.1 hypothetical protein LC087_07445 [Bacillus carboniphilus]
MRKVYPISLFLSVSILLSGCTFPQSEEESSGKLIKSSSLIEELSGCRSG